MNTIQIDRMLIGVVVATLLLLAAQRIGAQSSSAQVTINLRFLPVQTISVKSTEKVIDLLYATTENYENGVSVTHDDHLSVFSSGGFQVAVETTDANFTHNGGAETIPVGDVVVRADNGSSNNQMAQFTDAALSTSPSPLISSIDDGNDLAYTVTYDNTDAGSGQKYINRYLNNDQLETQYTATVIYSITAK